MKLHCDCMLCARPGLGMGCMLQLWLWCKLCHMLLLRRKLPPVLAASKRGTTAALSNSQSRCSSSLASPLPRSASG